MSTTETSLGIGGRCALQPPQSSIPDRDYLIELEAYSSSRYPEIFGPPEGHHPQPFPGSIRHPIIDNTTFSLKKVDRVPTFQEGEELIRYTIPALVIRQKNSSTVGTLFQIENTEPLYADFAMDCDDCKGGTHSEESASLFSCTNIQGQYETIRAACKENESEVFGKCMLIQRVVHRDGELLVEKGVSGQSFAVTGRAPLSGLLKAAE